MIPIVLNNMSYWSNIKFDDIAWTSLLHYAITGLNDAYVKALNDLEYGVLSLTEIIKEGRIDISDVLMTFLITWHTRPLSRKSEVPNLLNEKIAEIAEDIDSLNGESMITADPTKIQKCYSSLLSIGHNFSNTAASKTLHILCPEVFVMWDDKIRKKFISQFKEEIPKLGKSREEQAELYLFFLKKMGKITEQFSSDDIARLNLSYKSLQKGEKFFPKSKAKLIDEYNWIKVYKGINYPKEWPP